MANVVKMVYVAIARAPCAELVIEHMVNMMRGYRATDPQDPIAYFSWQQSVKADPELLTNLVPLLSFCLFFWGRERERKRELQYYLSRNHMLLGKSCF